MATIQIFLSVVNGTTLVTDVQPTDRINTIQTVVEDKCGIPPSYQVWTHNGKMLHDFNMTFKDYSIHDLSVINIQISVKLKPAPTIRLQFDLYDILPFIPSQNKPICEIECNKTDSFADILTQLGIIHLIESVGIYVCPTFLTISQIYNDKVADLIPIFGGKNTKIRISPKDLSAMPHPNINLDFIRKMHKLFAFNHSKRISCADTELLMMCLIIRFMTTVKSTDPLLQESILCLLEFTNKFGFPYVSESYGTKYGFQPLSISQSVLSLLSYTFDETIHSNLLGCISNIVTKGIHNKIFISMFLKNEIIDKLDTFAQLCLRSKQCLKHLSKIYYYICSGSNLLKIAETETRNWNVLFPLYTFLFFDDDTSIVNNIMRGFSCVVSEHVINSRDVDTILENKYCAGLKEKYQRRKDMNRVIFNGFIQNSVKLDDIEFIPSDIAWIIYQYFDSYKKDTNMNLLHRLTFILNEKNAYPMQLRNSALDTLQRIIQHCSRYVTNTLIYDCGLLDLLTSLLNNVKTDPAFECGVDDICWILCNAAFDNFTSIWESKIAVIMVDVFNLFIERNKHNIVGSLVLPFCALIERVNEHTDLVQFAQDKCGIIQGFCTFLDHLMLCPLLEVSTFGFNCNDIMSRMLDIFDIFLANDGTMDICVAQLKKNNGQNILHQIHQNQQVKVKLKINNGTATRAMNLGHLLL